MKKGNAAIQRPLISTALLLLLMTWGCGHKEDITGKWEGMLDISSIAQAQGKPGSTAYHIVLNIRKEGDHLAATLASPDEGPTEVTADAVEFKDGALTVKVSKRRETYEGRLNSEGTELQGHLQQEPYDIPLTLKR